MERGGGRPGWASRSAWLPVRRPEGPTVSDPAPWGPGPPRSRTASERGRGAWISSGAPRQALLPTTCDSPDARFGRRGPSTARGLCPWPWQPLRCCSPAQAAFERDWNSAQVAQPAVNSSSLPSARPSRRASSQAVRSALGPTRSGSGHAPGIPAPSPASTPTGSQSSPPSAGGPVPASWSPPCSLLASRALSCAGDPAPLCVPWHPPAEPYFRHWRCGPGPPCREGRLFQARPGSCDPRPSRQGARPGQRVS